MVFEGDARVEIVGVEHRMGTGDTTWVPAEVPHRFVNASAYDPHADLLDLRVRRRHPHHRRHGDTRSIDSERR